MSTKSILMTVEIKDTVAAQRFAEALEKAETIKVPIDNESVPLVKCRELHGEEIKKFFFESNI